MSENGEHDVEQDIEDNESWHRKNYVQRSIAVSESTEEMISQYKWYSFIDIG
jgi:hypothetical protein